MDVLHLKTYDLRGYLAEAKLPPVTTGLDPMTTGYHEPPNLEDIKIPPEGPDRVLRKIMRISHFKKLVGQFQQNIPESIPKPSVNSLTGEQFSIATPSGLCTTGPSYVHSFSSSKVSVEEVALQTASRAIQISFPKLEGAYFMEATNERRDADWFSSFHFTNTLPDNFSLKGKEKEEPEVSTRLMADKYHSSSRIRVHVLPSYIMTHNVMKELWGIRSLDPKYPPAWPTLNTNKDNELAIRLWHKFASLAEGAPFFIITNYQQWIFGCFGTSWNRAFISHLMEFDSTEPTVLQALVYWIGSATGQPKGFPVPNPPDLVGERKKPTESYHYVQPAPRKLDAGYEDDRATVVAERRRDRAIKYAADLREPRIGSPYEAGTSTSLDRIKKWADSFPDNTGILQKFPESHEIVDDDGTERPEFDPEPENLPDRAAFEERYELTVANLPVRDHPSRTPANPPDCVSLSNWSEADSGIVQPFGGLTYLVTQTANVLGRSLYSIFEE